MLLQTIHHLKLYPLCVSHEEVMSTPFKWWFVTCCISFGSVCVMICEKCIRLRLVTVLITNENG